MIRLCLAAAVGVFACALALRLSGTGWMFVMVVVACLYAVVIDFCERHSVARENRERQA